MTGKHKVMNIIGVLGELILSDYDLNEKAYSNKNSDISVKKESE